MLWLGIHFPLLPLEIFSAQACATAAATAEQPALVVLQDNRICMRNRPAKDQGIALGSTLATAHSICPELKYTHRDGSAESQRLRTLADALYRFSGYVSIQAPDCVVLEIGGSLKLFDNPQALCRAAAELCQALGHTVCARVAATPWASIALARGGQAHLADVPLCQAGLQLAEVPANTIERFANMGIYTLGPLLALPTRQLGKRFGKALLKYLAQLTGELPDPRKAITPTANFSQQLHLLEPLRNKAELYSTALSPMRKLAAELQQWLITHQLGCERLLWKFSSCGQEAALLPVRFAKGQQQQQNFIRISELKLAQTALPAEILSISLSAHRLTPWQNHSQSLFRSIAHGNTAAAGRDLSELVDELRARLGDDACQGIQSLTEHTPENAWQETPVQLATLNSANQKSIGKKSASQNGASQKSLVPPQAPGQAKHKRPLWLFARPRSVNSAELSLLHGPERLQTQWWDTPADCRQSLQQVGTQRDYYIAQHRLGAECWVFVDAHGQWYLHGYFG